MQFNILLARIYFLFYSLTFTFLANLLLRTKNIIISLVNSPTGAATVNIKDATVTFSLVNKSCFMFFNDAFQTIFKI